jgi:DNA-3-methyladenine glycosylase
VLLRAGEVVAGLDVATGRRPRSTVRDLARGPARLTQALAIGRELSGADVTAAGSPLQVHRGRPADPQQIRRGPRVGVTAAADRPWRVWLADEPTVSVYRRHVRRQRPGRTAECAGD